MTKIVMCYDDRLVYGHETEQINRDYCKAQGYQFVCYRHLPDPNLDIYWNRVRILQQELDGTEMVWWVDADAFFLRTDRRLPEDFPTPLAFSTDWNGICCGVMAVRNTSWANKFLTAWSILGNVANDRIKEFDHGQFREQTTVKALMHLWPDIANRISSINQECIQNATSHYRRDALVLHMWNNYIGTERALATLQLFRVQGYAEDIRVVPHQKT
jgi:hypothetical protein